MIRLIIDGMTYECDTATEAVAIRGLLTKPSTASDPERPQKATRGGRTRGARKQRNPKDVITGGTKRLLDALSQFPDVSMSHLAQKLGLKPTSLPPMFTTLRKRIAQLGLDPEKVIIRRQGLENGKPVSMYVLSDEGRQLALPGGLGERA